MSNTSLFNCRMEDELLDAIEESAQREGLKKSMWAREVMGAVALGGVTLAQLHELIKANGLHDQSPHPAKHLTLQGQTGRTEEIARKCAHPLPARRQLAFRQICSLCGQTVKRS
jgi:hypothetical protein